ncbi:MAG TPA: histidine kinase [Candidatus Dormibacteraeota bacterium]|nr:histidine kinase [Candidatus Dormibacteraeota bacterium]
MIGAFLLRKRLGTRSSVSDWVFALVMLAITLAGSIAEALAHVNGSGQTVVTGGHPVVANASWAAFVLVGVAAVSLAWRRRYPLVVLAVTLACVVVYSLLGYVNGTALLDVMIAVYTVATMVPSRDAWIAATVVVASLMAATAARNPFGALGGGEFVIPFEVAAAVSLGVSFGSRRAYLRAVEERAEQAERTREEEAARRVDAERLRIARELHDAVAHTLSMINVQAGAAAHVAHAHPERAVEALEAIRLASKEGLREMRSIVNVLRQADEAEGTQPAPGLAMLDDLLATATRAGLSTTLHVEGAPRRLPATVDLAAYRIIQESLTNAVRHAGPATATVSLAWRDGWLLVDVRDTGHGAAANGQAADGAAAGAGHGLVGMRERAAAVGGTVEAGPWRGGGFAVTAALPTEAGE